jgi:predicted esterase
MIGARISAPVHMFNVTALHLAPEFCCNLARWSLGLLALSCGIATAGQDMRLVYHCRADGTEPPYRLYIPSGYDPNQPSPLVIALHGSGGDENSFFDDEAHYPAAHGLKHAAEQYNVLAVCPSARGNTNYRGLGEISVFGVLEDVKKRYSVDDERVYLTGHSMGGTGATDLALHHPGLFAAVVPMAAARSIRWVAGNAEHTPFWWIGGALDQEFYKKGVAVGFERMKALGYPARFTELPGEGHYGTARDFRPVIAWLLQHRRVVHPKAFTLEVDTPLHPRAYWVTVEAIAHPGKIAVVKARAISSDSAQLDVDNIAALSVWPDPAVFDSARVLRLQMGADTVFTGVVPSAHEVSLTRRTGKWIAQVQPRGEISLTAYRNHPVATADESLDHSGTESRLGNWIADAMRAATSADIALYNHRTTEIDRPIPPGTVDIVDLLQCSLPGDQDLVTLELLGREILAILDANIPTREGRGGPASNLLVQLSGATYVFDRRLELGQRIVASSLHPERKYVVVLEGQVVERETMRLAGKFKQLQYTTANVPFTLALYGHAARSGKITASLEGRVREVK